MIRRMLASSSASTKFSTFRNPLRSQVPISSTVSAFMLLGILLARHSYSINGH